MTVVRHALAGNKREWAGPDWERALDPVGQRDAVVLAAQLDIFPIRRLISSPTVRCIQSLQPLADQTALVIERAAELRKDVRFDVFVTLITDVQCEDAVLCTHGEVMRPLLRQLRFDGVLIATDRPDRGDPSRLRAKGTAWRLTVSDSGIIERLQHIAPRR